MIKFEPFLKFVIEFHNSSLGYNRFLNEKISSRSDLFTPEEIAMVEEAFLVKHIAEWENFIHNILAYCVAIDTSKISEHLDLELPKKVSFDNAYAILNGMNFLSVTNTEQLKGLAKNILADKSNPFQVFQKPLLKKIDEAYALRNYVAHKSKRSKKSLMKVYNANGISEFIIPGFFLSREIDDKIGKYTVSSSYYGTFMLIATHIWRFLDKESYDFVYEDENSNEGWLQGMVKMNLVFEEITKNYKL